jgi:hypothetical protein
MRPLAATAWLVIAGLTVVGGVAQLGWAEGGPPRCFGAASRDPRKPCHNPALRYMVRPRPSIAEITPNEPCTRLGHVGPEVSPCQFGVPSADAVATVALIGDSHASHWRAALQTVALARHWRGISMTNGICPVSTVRRPLGDKARRRCADWKRTLVGWLRDHPAVTVVFHAQINSHKPVLAHAGESQFEARVHGYREIWRELPHTVRRIVAIRDNPTALTTTPDCVMRAHAHHQRPDRACALSRSLVLDPDPLAEAARRSRSGRVRLVSLTHFFCDARVCYPVVGGALVNKDQNHLTRVFSRTLGPFLLRRINHLVPSG